MPVFTIKEEYVFAEGLPITIYREGTPFAVIVGDGVPDDPATEGDKARAAQLRDALAASEPTPGAIHGASISEQVRLACSLAGTDSPAGLQELRDIVAYLGRLASAQQDARDSLAIVAGEIVYGDGTDASHQRAIDYSVAALKVHGIDRAAWARALAGDPPKPEPMRSALEAAEHWIEEQAWSPIAENGEILRVIRDALGKPHGATDAPAAATEDKPRFVIVIDNGCVTDVVSDDPAIIGTPYATLDHDTEGMQQDDEVRLIPQDEGGPREGYIREHVVSKADFPIGPATAYELAPGCDDEEA